jgi:hypothetical protein
LLLQEKYIHQLVKYSIEDEMKEWNERHNEIKKNIRAKWMKCEI